MAKKKQGGFFVALNELMGLNDCDEDFDDLDFEDLDEQAVEKALEVECAKQEEEIKNELAEALNQIEEEQKKIDLTKESEVDTETSETKTEEKKTRESATIDKTMIINGDIISDSDISILGIVNGSIKCAGHVYINGEINGNVEVDSLVVYNGKIIGNIVAAKSIIIKEDSHIEGNVVADDLSTNAHIVGTISANKVALLSRSIVEGDIFYKDLAIETGAKLKGNVNILDNN